MIYHGNRPLADDSHEISYLIFVKTRKDVAKIFVCSSRDWRLMGKKLLKLFFIDFSIYCNSLFRLLPKLLSQCQAKGTVWYVRQSKTQIRLLIRAV